MDGKVQTGTRFVGMMALHTGSVELVRPKPHLSKVGCCLQPLEPGLEEAQVLGLVDHL